MRSGVSTPANEIFRIFERYLPSRTGRCALQFHVVSEDKVRIDEEGNLFVELMVVIYDSADSESPQDIKQQEIYLGHFEQYPLERWFAYIEGHLRALPALVREFGSEVETLMPMDFFLYSRVLNDETLQTADDFAHLMSDPERIRAWKKERIREEWREMLEPCNLGEYVDEVRAMGRAALRLDLQRIENNAEDEGEDESDFPIGESRVGGDPDLPPEFAWPMIEDYPLTFVAQINLEEVALFETMNELPRKGLLSFFYAPLPPGDTPSNPVRVFHFLDIQNLERRHIPKDGERLTEYGIEFAAEHLFPSVESYFCYHSLLPEERVDEFYKSLAAGNAGPDPVPFNSLSYAITCMNDVYDHEGPTHRLLGHPDSIQGDPYLDIEMDQRPGRWDDWAEGTPEAYKIRKNALRWRLLLQIDAYQDDELLLNQDGGYFYFFIPAEALAKHDWTQVRGMLQCH